MRKIKIIDGSWVTNFEEKVNEFIEGKIIIDMQYQMNTDRTLDKYSVMIVYEE